VSNIRDFKLFLNFVSGQTKLLCFLLDYFFEETVKVVLAQVINIVVPVGLLTPFRHFSWKDASQVAHPHIVAQSVCLRSRGFISLNEP
jgi:hypothetical protein